MAKNLDDIISAGEFKTQKQFSKEEYRAYKKELWEQMDGMIGNETIAFAQNGAEAKRLLDIIASTGTEIRNAMLIAQQKKGVPTKFRTADEWKARPQKDEKGIYVFKANGTYTRDDGTEAISYKIVKAFEEKQMQIKIPSAVQNKKDPEMVLRALLNGTRINGFSIDNELPLEVGARYRHEDQIISIAKGMSPDYQFFVIAREEMHAAFALNEKSELYERGRNDLTAILGAYIISKTAGYELPINFDSIPQYLSGLDRADVFNELERTTKTANEINNRMKRNLYKFENIQEMTPKKQEGR